MTTYYVAGIPYSSSDIYHHGIKGQKWGVRRYTNPDGTLTEEGKRRYGTIENYNAIQQQKKQRAEDSRWASAQRGSEMLNNPKAVRRKILINTALAVGGGLVASGALEGVMKKTGFSDDKRVINQQVDWGRNSSFLNKASNAISYYKSTRKKK